MNLTDPAFIQRLESLSLLARRVLGGRLQANRRTLRKGGGVSFADYAEYKFGDDHRGIDWRVYGRLEQLMIKLFEMEEDMTLIVMLDTSASMAGKLDHTVRLAAALGYIALGGLDQVVIHAMSDRLTPLVEPAHGRGKVLTMLRSLQRVESAGKASAFNACCRALQARHRRKAMVVPVSDFLFPDGFDTGLSLLRHLGHEVFCLRVQDRLDQRCDLRGDIELNCVESGARRRVTVSPREAGAYERAVARWNQSLDEACARRGIGLASTTTEVAFDEVIQKILRRGGLVA